MLAIEDAIEIPPESFSNDMGGFPFFTFNLKFNPIVLVLPPTYSSVARDCKLTIALIRVGGNIGVSWCLAG